MTPDPDLTVRDNDILLPLTKVHLDVLAWFAAWTPEVHRATEDAWDRRRAWPPGFREFVEVGYRNQDNAATEMSNPPHPKHVFSVIRDDLLPWRLIEGTIRCARLTRRGRAALKFYGYDCPDEFDSHCIDIFDKVDLLPVVQRDMFSTKRMDLKTGALLPDDKKTWHWLLIEYNDESYQGRYTLNCASARLTQPSGTRALNGSMRTHSRYVSISVQNADGNEICNFALSHEQLADLLTSNSSVPVTIDRYFGPDGMRRAEPAPRPMDAMRRMLHRLQSAEDGQAKLLGEILATVKAAHEGKGRMGKRDLEALAHQIKVAMENGDANRAFVVREAQEEVSAVVESAWTILTERVALSEGEGVVGLLGDQGGGKRVLALLGSDPDVLDADE